MKTFLPTRHTHAITLTELLVVLATLFTVIAVFAWPALQRNRAHAERIRCVNNLKQVGLSFRVWEGNHGEHYPMNIPQTNGGTMEFITGPNAWRHFQLLSNELASPALLVCPSDNSRTIATNLASLRNSNLSYFVNVDAINDNDPHLVLSGDRNLTNDTPITDGLLTFTAKSPAGWTSAMHRKTGNLVLSDGSAQQTGDIGLREAIGSVTNARIRLQMPVLEP